MSINNSFTELGKVIEEVKHGRLGSASDPSDYFDVYWEKKSDYYPQLDDKVYIGEPQEVGEDIDDDNYDYEIMPEPVKQKGWLLGYSGEAIEDVIMNVTHQLGNTENQIILKAIRYYWKYDCFFDFIDLKNNAGVLK